MSTLTNLNRAPQTNWRGTHITLTERSAGDEREIFGRDSALVAFDKRKGMHAVLDQICSQRGFTQDKASRLHGALDRVLDAQGEPEEETDSEEPEEEAEDEPSETERVRKQHSGRDSVAMDSGKCSACKIQDNPVPAKKTPALDAAQNDMGQTVIRFWKQYGLNLQLQK